VNENRNVVCLNKNDGKRNLKLNDWDDDWNDNWRVSFYATSMAAARRL
jgi:hypothetical protein